MTWRLIKHEDNFAVSFT